MPRRPRQIRNPVALSPLLHKGGVHIKSKTGQRVREKQSLNATIDEWLDERDYKGDEIEKDSINLP